MNPRFSLALVAVFLIGGALALWWSDRQQPGAPPVQPISSAQSPVESAEPLTPVAPDAAGYDGAYVLTIEWHPAFCETKPNLGECRDERSSDYAADHFSLHGLWPQDDEYCGVGQQAIAIDESNRWSDLPAIKVADATWRDLQRVMPGTVGSLERHEWTLHGSCAGVSADTFFRRAIALVEDVNGSAVRKLFAANVGREISRNQIRAAFDTAFGSGAGRKVRVDCADDAGRQVIDELRINIKGAAMTSASLRDLMRAATNAGSGCSAGTVDQVGDQ